MSSVWDEGEPMSTKDLVSLYECGIRKQEAKLIKLKESYSDCSMLEEEIQDMKDKLKQNKAMK
ncbi:hypothetical protein EEL30_21830 [Brevibacillus laterosporus]|uniref:Uncharacterized protein n=1 Tax=Brevibacillus laterosporus TaxID=1465 RepID=A0A518VCG4_BRELA|nr:hypothetical protein EEL30_21830 [Brevibacillus laterosporus]